ncbi:MAG: DUF4363 family protein [Eubacteriales bacterium]|nr:DUF4363 family protein [Eubacteriales bacterium]
MKHFIIALVLLGLIIACVCVNGYFVRKTVGEALELTRSLPETKEEFDSYDGNIQAFADQWYKWHGYLSLSINVSELERVCEAVADIKAYVQVKAYDNYIAAKRRLEAVLSELADGEKPVFFHIF